MTATFNYKRDTKSNRQGDIYTPKGYDACQTPAEALTPLLPYLDQFSTFWEPAAGECYLAAGLSLNLHLRTGRTIDVRATDILTGDNFFTFELPLPYEAIVTNPPYSIKYKWLRRCYELGKPFALLMPVEMLGAKTAQQMFALYGIEIIFLARRVNFKMPNKGWLGKGAQFPVCWYTWGLGIGQQVIFPEVKQEQLSLFEA